LSRRDQRKGPGQGRCKDNPRRSTDFSPCSAVSLLGAFEGSSKAPPLVVRSDRACLQTGSAWPANTGPALRAHRKPKNFHHTLPASRQGPYNCETARRTHPRSPPHRTHATPPCAPASPACMLKRQGGALYTSNQSPVRHAEPSTAPSALSRPRALLVSPGHIYSPPPPPREPPIITLISPYSTSTRALPTVRSAFAPAPLNMAPAPSSFMIFAKQSMVPL